MPWTFLCLIAALASLAIYYFKRHFSYWERRGVPSEQPVFPFGNFKGIGKVVHFRDVNTRIYNQFKGSTPVVGLYLMLQRALMVIDLEIIKNVLIKDFSNFHDRGVYSNVRDDPLTGHLFTLDGEQWRSMRMKLSPVFTSGKMKFMFPTITALSDRLIEACASIAATEKDGALDLKELCARYTTDVIGSCAFGLECNSLQDPNAEFRNKGRAVFGNSRHSQIVQAFIITNQKLARALRMKLFPDDVSEFFMNAVKSTVDYRIKNKVKRNDFMDMLIEMKAENEEAARKNNGIDLSNGLTIEQMAAQAFVFFVAGFDTSATTMSFCLYELALNQQIQNKLREEIVSVLKKHDNKVTYEAVKEMTYLDQVLAETLRKYSVLPHLIRKSINEYKIPNTNYVIEPDTMIIIPISTIQKDPEYFPDPEKFDPSRFDPEEVKSRHPMTYLPFGDGPRNCIGMRFGKMQARVGLISLLTNYKFSKCARTEEPVVLEKRNFIISAENGIYLHVERL